MAAKTYNVLMKSGYTCEVENVVAVNRVDVVYYAKRNYRNLFDANRLGRAIPEDPAKLTYENSSVTPPITTTASAGASGSTVVFSDGAAVDALRAQAVMPSVPDTYMLKSDDYLQEEPRHEALKRTMLRMWAGVVFTLSGTLTTASRNVTVASTASVVAGQTVSAAGIPDGTVVLSVTNGTTFVLSQAATSTGAEDLTFANGDLLFESEDDLVESYSTGTWSEI